MMKNLKRIILNRPILFSLLIFVICLIVRIVEYFVIRTDTTIFSENFIHKLFGIFLLLTLLKIMNYRLSDIGFRRRNLFKYLGWGLLLGLACFSVAYIVEYILLSASAQHPRFELYANGFSLAGSEVKHTEIYFFVLCILLNIINVVMEEGLFRGFFYKIISRKNSFLKSILIVALLFGLWHFVMPLQLLVSGEADLWSSVVMMLGYVVLAGIMSLKWSLLYKMTGSLFMGIGDHLFNNVIATNLLHLVADGGADKLQIVRILIAQAISFVAVLLVYRKTNSIIKKKTPVSNEGDEKWQEK